MFKSNEKEVYDHYNNGAEMNRLDWGLGVVEFYRTKEIISCYLTEKSTVYDIGGGIGKYAEWLAEQGHDVTMIEQAPHAVEYAKKHMKTPYIAEVGDAREIKMPAESADIVLLMGPLYHLQDNEEREKALSEAYRVLKKGGLLIASGISKFSSTTWAVSVYGTGYEYIDDDVYMNMLMRELATGEHNRPKEYRFILPSAYFHTLDGLRNEINSAGFTIVNHHAVEGCVWLSPKLESKWQDDDSRRRFLDIIHATEHEETLIGISPHFIVVGSK